MSQLEIECSVCHYTRIIEDYDEICEACPACEAEPSIEDRAEAIYELNDLIEEERYNKYLQKNGRMW